MGLRPAGGIRAGAGCAGRTDADLRPLPPAHRRNDRSSGPGLVGNRPPLRRALPSAPPRPARAGRQSRSASTDGGTDCPTPGPLPPVVGLLSHRQLPGRQCALWAHPPLRGRRRGPGAGAAIPHRHRAGGRFRRRPKTTAHPRLESPAPPAQRRGKSGECRCAVGRRTLFWRAGDAGQSGAVVGSAGGRRAAGWAGGRGAGEVGPDAHRHQNPLSGRTGGCQAGGLVGTHQPGRCEVGQKCDGCDGQRCAGRSPSWWTAQLFAGPGRPSRRQGNPGDGSGQHPGDGCRGRIGQQIRAGLSGSACGRHRPIGPALCGQAGHGRHQSLAGSADHLPDSLRRGAHTGRTGDADLSLLCQQSQRGVDECAWPPAEAFLCGQAL